MDRNSVPFEVGQQVEARSFVKGYRGAWFRCKIKEQVFRKKDPWLALEYFDFPDEKIGHTKLYQKGSNSKGQKQVLMVRPRFPDFHHESQFHDIKTLPEVVVIIKDVWKVGHLVDWWTDGCYWSGRITETMGNEKVKISLPPPPAGEGLSYEAFCKDLRPSLDWSVHEGWKLPIPKDGEDQLSCAWIVRPLREGVSSNLIEQTISEGKKDVQPTAGASTEHEDSDSNISSHVDASLQCPGKIQLDIDGNGSSKNQRILLNSTFSDTIEAAILDLEELICRVKWLRGILEVGMPVSNTVKSSWKFVEHRASSKPL